MSEPSPTQPAMVPPPPNTRRWREGLGLVTLGLACLALLTPLSKVEVQGRLGLLLVLTAVVEIAHGFRRSTAAGQKSAWISGILTGAMGTALIHAPYLATTALVFALAAWFGFDGVRYLWGAFRRPGRGSSTWVWIVAGFGNLAIAGLLLALSGRAVAWTVTVAAFFRILGTAWNIFLAPIFTAGDSAATVAEDLGLIDRPEVQGLARQVAAEETARAPIDRGWILGFIATLFAIHIGRMGFDRTFLGVFSPGFAVLGDLFVALVLAFVLVIPATLLWRRLTRAPERWAWEWCLRVPVEQWSWRRRLVHLGLRSRLRSSIRLRQARYSFRTAFSRGLQIGLPLAAIIAATVPVWGMSWYFDTEN